MHRRYRCSHYRSVDGYAFCPAPPRLESSCWSGRDTIGCSTRCWHADEVPTCVHDLAVCGISARAGVEGHRLGRLSACRLGYDASELAGQKGTSPRHRCIACNGEETRTALPFLGVRTGDDVFARVCRGFGFSPPSQKLHSASRRRGNTFCTHVRRNPTRPARDLDRQPEKARTGRA